MFDQYEPTIKATITFLKLLSVKVNDSSVNETLQNHPDWPSMLSVSDSLNKWKIPNGVGKINANKIEELPLPFIAFTNDIENPLAIVTKITEETIEKRQNNYRKNSIEKKDSFLQNWNGIYLLAERNDNSGETDFNKNKTINLINSLVPIIAFVLFIGISLLLLQKNILSSLITNGFTITGIYFQYFIILSGFIITSLLLWYEIDKNNPLLQKVCTGINKGNCNAILTGSAATVFSWLSWSEVGFFYFSGAMLTLILSSKNILPVIALISTINILAVSYTFFSIYYQWKIVKQWCLLCLGVQAIIILGIINSLINDSLSSFTSITTTILFESLLFYIFSPLIWFTIKPQILNLQQSKNTKRQFLRIKYNSEIFTTLLNKQKNVNISSPSFGIDIGNSNAINTIIKVCNPYCGPCATTHPKIEKLIAENKNIKAKIIFTTPNNERHPAYNITSHLVSIAAENDQAKTKKALDDWYLAKVKDYEEFTKKYPITIGLNEEKKSNQYSKNNFQDNVINKEEIGLRITAMEKWCRDLEIRDTPTIFINGYKIPDAYSIEDLEYFLQE